ncbi:MutS domain V [bacterium A37T11]|nr:MutS domain V [bacterium A37T11]
MQLPINQEYQQRVATKSAELTVLNKKINAVSLFRLFVIVGGAILIFQCFRTEIVWLSLVSVLFVLLVFMGLVSKQSKLERIKKAAEDERWVNQNELDIWAGKPNGYADGAEFFDSKHPYTSDLDVFGEASLYALINRCSTPEAIVRLAGWLDKAADPSTIAERQEAIKELAAKLNWTQRVQAGLLFNRQEKINYERRFATYLNSPLLNFAGKALRLYVKVGPWLLLLAIGLSFFIKPFTGIAVVIGLIHLLMTIGYAGTVTRVSAGIDKMSNVLAAFAAVFKQVETEDWQSALNKRLALQLYFEGKQPVSAAIKDLSDIISRLEYRNNMLIGGLYNIFLLWDFRQVFAVLAWRRDHQGHVLGAFDAISHFEALISLAALHRNHPDWSLPEISNSGQRSLVAIDLKHPLIPALQSVANTYRMENHRIALITGSNMAGKSTFLRTVGSNMVLAFAGAPVCAAHMLVSVVHLVTYMRIRDSLHESTSTFKAELDRMQMILQSVECDKEAFFLLDEMLRGTNSVDKYRGSKAVIQKLIADQGTGIVATHDLQLAKLAEENPGIVQNFHFDIQVHEGEMLFDYKIKDGECTIFNASMLLRQIGVIIEE